MTPDKRDRPDQPSGQRQPGGRENPRQGPEIWVVGLIAVVVILLTLLGLAL